MRLATFASIFKAGKKNVNGKMINNIFVKILVLNKKNHAYIF